jgi:hypothetical protein
LTSFCTIWSWNLRPMRRLASNTARCRGFGREFGVAVLWVFLVEELCIFRPELIIFSAALASSFPSRKRAKDRRGQSRNI